jgi:hypothetical protein
MRQVQIPVTVAILPTGERQVSYEDLNFDFEILKVLKEKKRALELDYLTDKHYFEARAKYSDDKSSWLMILKDMQPLEDSFEYRSVIRNIRLSEQYLHLNPQTKNDDFDLELANQVSIQRIVESYGIRIIQKKVLCPFHDEKTPSMSVNIEKNYWHCFGCGQGGDGIKFVMKKENCSFKDALKIIIRL